MLQSISILTRPSWTSLQAALRRPTYCRNAVSRIPILFAVVACLSSHAEFADGSVVHHVSLRTLSKMAGVAFAGTVDSTEVTILSGQIVTLVHFSNLRVAKGALAQDRLTLRMFGGTYGGIEDGVVDMPRFEQGRRYIVLARSDLGSPRERFDPIIGLYQGFYPVQKDSLSGQESVHDWAMRPVAAVAAGHIVVVRPNVARPRSSGQERPTPRVGPMASPTAPDNGSAADVLQRDEDPGTRVSEATFLELVRQFAAE